jgi:hypothetical protein
MSFQQLPEELVDQILSQLKPSSSPGAGFLYEHALLRSTLRSCKVVSKQLCRLAEPLLYHTVTSGQLDRALQFEELTPARRGHMVDLVRVLYANHAESRAIVTLPGLSNAPITQVQVEICANLEVLVLSVSTYPRLVLPPQLLRYYDALPSSWSRTLNVPLTTLCRFEIRPIEYLRDDLDLASDGWLLLLARLPQMENISVPTITERALAPSQGQAPHQDQASPQEQPLNIKSLALTSQPLTPELLEAILKTFPLLEELSVTWPEKRNSWPTVADIWPRLGAVLGEHGLSLRKIHFEWKKASRGQLVNLAYLCDLHSLALPIEAVISEPLDHHGVPTAADDAGLALLAPNRAGEGANTFTIPLSYILPPNLRCLMITDYRDLRADADRLDNQLRDLMVHRTFSALRSIQLRRKRPFIQSGGWGWFKHSPDRFWQVMERRRSTM